MSRQELQVFDQTFENQDWLSITEAAQFLRIFRKSGKPCERRIRNLVYMGKLPVYKPFGRLLFKKSELQKIIESSRMGTLDGYK